MDFYKQSFIKKTDRISRIVERTFAKLPEIESDRARLLTESYRATENLPTIIRRAKAFEHILKNIPIVIREEELIVGSSTTKARGCQTFPEYSYEWLEAEFDTVAERSADPFYISEKTKAELKEANAYWKGKTNSELATSYMEPETLLAMEHNVFTPGNYFYNGIGHVTVHYDWVLAVGFKGIRTRAENELKACCPGQGNYAKKSRFLQAVIISCDAAIHYAHRYAELAYREAEACADPARKKELLVIAKNCLNVPENGASDFYEACQSFWFVQQLLQMESSGHSISPGRFDQYMYPYFKKDYDAGKITLEFAQELLDCIWIKLNDLNKCRDAASAEGFAGYSLFQNLIVGGQNEEGLDVTNELSYMCLEASMHVQLPQPSLSIRVWNGSPEDLLIKAAELTRTGVGLPAYYNDEVIIPALMARGLTLEDARTYNIIGCVEPQKAGKTDGWHDAAFFNMCRPFEFALHDGRDGDVQVGPHTGDAAQFTTFEEVYEAYQKQMNYFIRLLVNADNAIDVAHAERTPLPFLSSMVEDCISEGKSVQEGGAVYNFTGPQGFGVANMADSLYTIKKLVFEEKRFTMAELIEAVDHNFGHGVERHMAEKVVAKVSAALAQQGKTMSEAEKEAMKASLMADRPEAAKYKKILDAIEELPKFGNDVPEVDYFAREVAYTYTKPIEKYENPRGGRYQAGLYPVSANVPLGAQTGALPDGRFANMPVADGVSPTAGRDTHGPTAAANSVSKLDHYIASNGTLYNQKFHPSALAGRTGLHNFVALIRTYFDKKGSHMQFNVVSKETLLDAQKNPEKYKHLVVRVAGYSALFTTLSKSLQDDIINRTEQGTY
jgi:hypothetical protein